MSAFKRKGSPYLQVWPTVPGHGRVGPWSTGTKDKRLADAMERLLQELPLRGFGDLLRLVPKQLSLADLYVAHLEDRLDQVRAQAGDPMIAAAVGTAEDDASFLNQVGDDRVRAGLLELVRLAPGERLSYLRDPKNVEDILHKREREGVKRNSVRRSLYRAISELLDRELGGVQKTAIMGEVNFPTADDERQVTLRPEQLAKLLDSIIDPLFECFVGLAVTTGIDRGPLLRITPSHLLEAAADDQDDVLDVLDHKTSSRPRSLAIPKEAALYLRRAIQLSRAGPDDRVFAWTINQVRDRWNAARDEAKLPWLRFKDLRSVFSDAFVAAGGTLKDLQGVLGHSSSKTSIRYTRAQPIRQRETMERGTKLMGFGERHLKVEESA